MLRNYSEPQIKAAGNVIADGVIPNSTNDCFCRIKKDVVIKVVSVSGSKVVGHKFIIDDHANFYEKPFKSSLFGIYKSSGLEEMQSWSVDEFTKASKCIVFPLNSQYVIFPLLHLKMF